MGGGHHGGVGLLGGGHCMGWRVGGVGTWRIIGITQYESGRHRGLTVSVRPGCRLDQSGSTHLVPMDTRPASWCCSRASSVLPTCTPLSPLLGKLPRGRELLP